MAIKFPLDVIVNTGTAHPEGGLTVRYKMLPYNGKLYGAFEVYSAGNHYRTYFNVEADPTTQSVMSGGTLIEDNLDDGVNIPKGGELSLMDSPGGGVRTGASARETSTLLRNSTTTHSKNLTQKKGYVPANYQALLAYGGGRKSLVFFYEVVGSHHELGVTDYGANAVRFDLVDTGTMANPPLRWENDLYRFMPLGDGTYVIVNHAGSDGNYFTLIDPASDFNVNSVWISTPNTWSHYTPAQFDGAIFYPTLVPFLYSDSKVYIQNIYGDNVIRCSWTPTLAGFNSSFSLTVLVRDDAQNVIPSTWGPLAWEAFQKDPDTGDYYHFLFNKRLVVSVYEVDVMYSNITSGPTTGPTGGFTTITNAFQLNDITATRTHWSGCLQGTADGHILLAEQKAPTGDPVDDYNVYTWVDFFSPIVQESVDIPITSDVLITYHISTVYRETVSIPIVTNVQISYYIANGYSETVSIPIQSNLEINYVLKDRPVNIPIESEVVVSPIVLVNKPVTIAIETVVFIASFGYTVTIQVETNVGIEYLVYRNINLAIETIVSVDAVVLHSEPITIPITTNLIANYDIASDIEVPAVTILTGAAYPEGGLTVRHKMLPYGGKLYGAFEIYSSGNHYRTYFNVEADPATKSVMSGGTLIVDDLDEGTTIPKGGEISVFDSPGDGTRSGLAARETSSVQKNSSNSTTVTRTSSSPSGYEPDNYEMMCANDGSGSIVFFTKDVGGHDLLYASPNTSTYERFDFVDTGTMSNPPLRWEKDLYRISPFGDNTHIIVTHTGTGGHFVLLVDLPYARISGGGFATPTAWTHYPDAQFDGAKFHPTLVSFLHGGIRYVQDIYSDQVCRCTWIPNTGNFPADYHRYFLTRDDAQNVIPATWGPLAWETYQKSPITGDYYHFLYNKRLVGGIYEVDVMYSNVTSGPTTGPTGGFRTKVNVFQIDDITATRTHWSGSLQNTASGPALLAEQKAPTGDPVDDYNLYIWIDWFNFDVLITVDVEILTTVSIAYITQNPDAALIPINSVLSVGYVIEHTYELYEANVVIKVGTAYPEGGLYVKSNMLPSQFGGTKLYGAFESYDPGNHYRTYYNVEADSSNPSVMSGGSLIVDDLDVNANYRKGGDQSLLIDSLYERRHGVASRQTTTKHIDSYSQNLTTLDDTSPVGYEPENYEFVVGSDSDPIIFFSHFNSPNYELHSFQLGYSPQQIGVTFTAPILNDYFRVVDIFNNSDVLFFYGNDDKLDIQILNPILGSSSNLNTINWSNNNLPDSRWGGARGYTTLIPRFSGLYGYTQNIIGNTLLRTKQNKSTFVLTTSTFTNFVGSKLDNLGGAGDWNTLAWQTYQARYGTTGDYYHFIFRKKFIGNYYQIDVAYSNIFNDTLGDYYYIDNIARVYDINPTRTHWAGCSQGLSSGPMLLVEQKAPTGDPIDDYNIYILVDFFITFIKKIIKIQIETEVNISFEILKFASVDVLVDSDLSIAYKIEKPTPVSIPIQTDVTVSVEKSFPVLIQVVSTVSVNYVIEKTYSTSIPIQTDVAAEYIVEHHYLIFIPIDSDVSIQYVIEKPYSTFISIEPDVLIDYVTENHFSIFIPAGLDISVQYVTEKHFPILINVASGVSIEYIIISVFDINVSIETNVEINYVREKQILVLISTQSNVAISPVVERAANVLINVDSNISIQYGFEKQIITSIAINSNVIVSPIVIKQFNIEVPIQTDVVIDYELQKIIATLILVDTNVSVEYYVENQFEILIANESNVVVDYLVLNQFEILLPITVSVDVEPVIEKIITVTIPGVSDVSIGYVIEKNIVVAAHVVSNVSIGYVIEKNITATVLVVSDVSIGYVIEKNITATVLVVSNVSIGYVIAKNIVVAVPVVSNVSIDYVIENNIVVTVLVVSDVSIDYVIAKNIAATVLVVSDVSIDYVIAKNIAATVLVESDVSIGYVIAKNIAATVLVESDVSIGYVIAKNIVVAVHVVSNVSIGYVIAKNIVVAIPVVSNVSIDYVIAKNIVVAIHVVSNVSTSYVIAKNIVVAVHVVSNISIGYVIAKNIVVAIPVVSNVSIGYFTENQNDVLIQIDTFVLVDYQQIHTYPVLVNIDSNVQVTRITEIQKTIDIAIFSNVTFDVEIYWAQYIILHLTINLYSNVSILYDIAHAVSVDVNIDIESNVIVNYSVNVTTLKHHINHHYFGVKWQNDFIDIVNEKRAYFGLPAFSKPTALQYYQFQDIAQQHSNNMRDAEVFGHDSASFPVGWQTFYERVGRIGLNGAEVLQARNPNLTEELFDSGVDLPIIVNNDTFPAPQQVVDSWWIGGLHRDILLTDWGSEYPVYSYMGMTTTQNDIAGAGSGTTILLTNVFISLERIMSNIYLNINYQFEGADIKVFKIAYDLFTYTKSITQHYTTWAYLVEKQHEISYGANISKQHHAKYFNSVSNQLHIHFIYTDKVVVQQHIKYDIKNTNTVVKQHENKYSFGVVKQHNALYYSMDFVAKQHNALYHSTIIIAAQHNAFYQTAEHITKQHNALYHKVTVVVTQHNALYHVNNEVVTQHNAFYHVHNKVITQHNAFYHVNNEVITQHNALYHKVTVVATQHNALYHVNNKVITQHNALYHVNNKVITQHNALYYFMNRVIAQHNTNYRLMGITHKQHQTLYSIRLTAAAQHNAFYTPTGTIVKQHETIYDLSLRNTVVKSHRILYSLMPASLIIAKPFVQMTNGDSITEIVLSASDSEYFWNATIRLADISDYNNLTQDQNIEIIVGGDTYKLMVVSKTKERTGTVGTDLQITASSQTIRLDSPRATPDTFIFDTSTTIKIAVETILGQATNWDLIDWIVPPYKIMYTEQVPIEAAQSIIKTVGGALFTENDGSITVAPIEKVNTHRYFSETPDHIFVDENDIIKISEGHTRKEGYNKFRIREGDSVFSDKADWIVNEGENNKGVIKVYPSPWRENITACTTQDPVTTTITKIGVVERQESQDADWEVIEFVDGSAATRYPIKNIDEQKWLSTALSGLVFEPNSTVINTSTAINNGYGLLALKYTTRSIDFNVEGVYDDQIQVLIKKV